MTRRPAANLWNRAYKAHQADLRRADGPALTAVPPRRLGIAAAGNTARRSARQLGVPGSSCAGLSPAADAGTGPGAIRKCVVMAGRPV